MRYPKINPQNDIKHLVSVLLGLIPMVALFFFLSPVDSALDMSTNSTLLRMMLFSAFFIALTAIPSFFICRHNSQSVWYLPGFVVLSSMWPVAKSVSGYWSLNAKVWLFVAALAVATVLGILGSLKKDKISGE